MCPCFYVLGDSYKFRCGHLISYINSENGWYKLVTANRSAIGGLILIRGDWYYQPGGSLLLSFNIDGDKSPYITRTILNDLRYYNSITKLRYTYLNGNHSLEFYRAANHSNVEITTFILVGDFVSSLMMYNSLVPGSGTEKGSVDL